MYFAICNWLPARFKMATKKNLYKPVPESVVNPKPGKRRNRRPLPQGRLVSSEAETAAARPRLQQGNLSASQASFLSSTLRAEDPTATPRRQAPVPPPVSHQSPLPSRVLDLSDDETDITDTYTETDTKGGRVEVSLHHHPQVMVLDASSLGSTPDRAEVECTVNYERSQVKVVCHNDSPRARGIGSPWKLQEDRVPRVGAAAISPLSIEADVQEGQNLCGGESDIDTILQLNRSSRSHQKNRSIRVDDSEPKLPQPNFDDSGESEKGRILGVVMQKKQMHSEAPSDSETCSLFEYVPQNRSRTTVPPDTIELKPPQRQAENPKHPPPRSEKKKKGDRIVPSRYMQSAKRSLADKSLLGKKSVSLGSFGISNSNNNSGQANASSGKKTPGRPQSARRIKSAVTASPSREKVVDRGGQGKTSTSTPTHDHTPTMVSCDASAINPELSMMMTSVFDASHFKSGSGSGHLDNLGSPRKAKKVDPRVQQQRIDMAYARYLQWAFLDAKATKMLQQQEKDATRQLYGLWAVMEGKRHEKFQVEEDVAKLKTQNALDRQIELQYRPLEHLVSVVPMLKKDFTCLSSALDATRHHIQTRGIHIPEDEDFYLASLEQALEESEQLLGNLSMLTKRDAPVVHEFADAAAAVEKAVDEECQELYKCNELLAATRSLVTHENSLRIQSMQSSVLD